MEKRPVKNQSLKSTRTSLERLLFAACESKQADPKFNNSRSAQESAPSFGFKIYRY
jgi:hypothetical protein